MVTTGAISPSQLRWREQRKSHMVLSRLAKIFSSIASPAARGTLAASRDRDVPSVVELAKQTMSDWDRLGVGRGCTAEFEAAYGRLPEGDRDEFRDILATQVPAMRVYLAQLEEELTRPTVI